MISKIFLLVFFIHTSYEINNGLGRTPQMGWNSWAAFGCNINEKLIQQTADAVVATGLAAAGYQYIILDDCWQGSRDAQGTLEADPQTFPSSIPVLADYIHSKNLKSGIFSDAGPTVCFSHRPGSLGYEKKDANTFASWKIDYLKYDNCYDGGSTPQERFSIMRDALNATGRSIFYSIVAASNDRAGDWGTTISNSWSTGYYSQYAWLGILNNIDLNDQYADRAGPGGWNDPGILLVGVPGLTDAEYVTQFSLWAISKAPLVIGRNIMNLSSAALSILKNPEVIAVNQDPLGVQGKKVAFAWSKSLNGTHSVGLANCSSFSSKNQPKNHQWQYSSQDGSIRSIPYGKCLSLASCDTNNAIAVVIDECRINDPLAPCQGKNQQWTINAVDQSIVSVLNGYCLDIYYGDGSILNAAGCNQGNSQRWIWSEIDSTVRNKVRPSWCLTEIPELEVWYSPLQNRSSAVVLFNRGDTTSEPITVQWSDIGLDDEFLGIVRDLWNQRGLGIYTSNYTSPNIDPHSVMMLKISY